MNSFAKAAQVMDERFGHDSHISLATVDGKRPAVRHVNGYYEDGAFYIVTYGRSDKMRQIAKNPEVALCGDWFTARGVGETLGHPREERNAALMDKLRGVFAAWYGEHANESDPHTCVLRVRLMDGVLFDHGARYDIDFAKQKA